jgi:hypothetical protein
MFVFVEPRKQTHVREGDSARYFLIYVVCICMCVCSFPSKTSVKSRNFGPHSQLQHPISSIQHVFEEVCHSLCADHFHPFEWIPNFVMATASEGNYESIGQEFDVITNHSGIHSNQFNGEGINNTLLPNFNSAFDDLNDPCFR